LVADAGEITSTNEDSPYPVDEIVDWIDVGGHIGPIGHTTDGREESAE